MRAFVYGTLTDPDRVASVLDEWSFEGPAVIDGLHRVEGRYPTLAPGGTVGGNVLDTPEVDRLDAYESVPDLYVRVSVPHADGGVVSVYVGDPSKLDAPAEWPGDGPFADRVRAFLDAESVIVRPDRQR